MNSIRFLVFLALSISSLTVSAQFGLRLKTNFNKFSNTNAFLKDTYSDNIKLYPQSYEIGVDYWFRLKKRRIEFLPELFAALGKTETTLNPSFSSDLKVYGFAFHTQIYALDLEGDCNCPTFSKQGPSINKGLFFHFSPKVALFSEKTIANSVEATQDTWLFGAGVGLGLDLGVSDLLTITPILTYSLFSSYNTLIEKTVSDNPSQIQLTLRLGFRPDYNRRRR